MTILVAYQWRRFSPQQQPVVGDYLKFCIRVSTLSPQVNNYIYTILKGTDSRPFVCMQPQIFLSECREFLSAYLSDLRSLSLIITDLVMPVIQNRFQFVVSPASPSAPKEFKMNLLFCYIADGVKQVYLRDATITEYDPEIQGTHLPASSEAILSLLKKSKVIKSGECCLICMEEFHVSGSDGDVVDDVNGIGEEGYSIPCGHVFHQHCILSWLLTSHMCPLCRNPLPANDH